MFHYEDGWEPLETRHVGSSGGVHELTAVTDSFSPFAVGTQMTDISVTDAAVTTETITVGAAAEVRVTLENAGGVEGAEIVTIQIGDDMTVDRREIIEGSTTEAITLEPTIDQPGEYEVTVNGVAAGTLRVEQTDTGDNTSEQSPENQSDTATGDSEETAEPESSEGSDEQSSDGSVEDSPGVSSNPVPGFGVLAALIAMVVAALLARRDE
jgi:PGF-CTERM protein